MTFPTVEHHLPDLMPFIHALANDYRRKNLYGWPAVRTRVSDFFTLGRMAHFDSILPGWQMMAAYREGTTLVHVIAALAALMLLPEYQQAGPDQQAQIKWIILFHDLTKRLEQGIRDHTHAFRSAALAGRQLPRLGFSVLDSAQIEPWAALTAGAIMHDTPEPVQDNRQLPEILAGLERLFGPNTPAALIVKTVLLHMSINTLHEWPQAAPFTDDEIARYVDPAMLPLLEMMMLIDNDAWAFFDPETKQRHRAETLDVFARVRRLVGV